MLVDWLPWNHTFGGNHNVGITLYNGGTLYIDDGKPTPDGHRRDAAQPARDLADDVLQRAQGLRGDRARDGRTTPLLRESLFARVQGLHVRRRRRSARRCGTSSTRTARRTIGERMRIITGLGMTETAPSCTFAVGPDSAVGPHRPAGARRRGQAGARRRQDRDPLSRPQRDAGLLARAASRRAEAFDEEGFYRTGDAVRWIDPADPQRGLLFDGRIAEDFKLSTGTFVSVGPLRARIIGRATPACRTR